MRVKFTTSLDDKVILKLKIYAAENNTDASKIIEKLLIEFFEQEKSPK